MICCLLRRRSVTYVDDRISLPPFLAGTLYEHRSYRFRRVQCGKVARCPLMVGDIVVTVDNKVHIDATVQRSTCTYASLLIIMFVCTLSLKILLARVRTRCRTFNITSLSFIILVTGGKVRFLSEPILLALIHVRLILIDIRIIERRVQAVQI